MNDSKGNKYKPSLFDAKAKKMKQDLNIPDKEATEWEDVFRVLDEDNSGQIDADEVTHVMQAMGQKVTPTQVREMISKDDVSGDGQIDFAEFLRLMWKHHCKEIDYHKDLVGAFRVFDKDGNGTIDKDELRVIVSTLGDEPLTEDEAKALIDRADLNGDGKIDFYEFAKMMRSPPSP